MALIMKYIDSMHHYMDKYGGEYQHFDDMDFVTSRENSKADIPRLR